MRWKIGQLARRTGTTVRTLRHYEQLGLIRPARTGTGHRVYGEHDAARLSHVLLLRRLGLPLEEVGHMLDDPEHDLARAIEHHAARIRRRMETDRAWLERLDALGREFRVGRGGSSIDELLHTVERIEMQEKYFTPEQLQRLDERRRTIGGEAIRAAELEWPKLIATARELLDEGASPEDPRVRRVAARWRELVQAFTGGDPGLAESVGRMYRAEPEIRASTGIDEALLEFVARAQAIADEDD
jgi:DNA-binding transcriptional MerR regulator